MRSKLRLGSMKMECIAPAGYISTAVGMSSSQAAPHRDSKNVISACMSYPQTSVPCHTGRYTGFHDSIMPRGSIQMDLWLASISVLTTLSRCKDGGQVLLTIKYLSDVIGGQEANPCSISTLLRLRVGQASPPGEDIPAVLNTLWNLRLQGWYNLKMLGENLI